MGHVPIVRCQTEQPIRLEVTLEGEPRELIVDTGAAISVLATPVKGAPLKPTKAMAWGADGSQLGFCGEQELTVEVCGTVTRHTFLVFSQEGTGFDLFGLDLMKKVPLLICPDKREAMVALHRETGNRREVSRVAHMEVPVVEPGMDVPTVRPATEVPGLIPHMEVPVVEQGMDVPIIGPGTEVSKLVPHMEVPVDEPGMDVPTIGPGTEVPRLVPHMEVPMVEQGMDVPIIGPGTEVSKLVPHMEIPVVEPGMDVPIDGLGGKTPDLASAPGSACG
ncbi:hypothetical protein GE061_013012 [Apolygus lucorum]|uniref:Peptidase A2 domain-containing protein n=1 Tax=Apolygus lucorum TaxID=248454 RepID=A0A8S9XV98_APOLU|nr:hypothetical protein GE061_013012 [Apolygus lucorum]